MIDWTFIGELEGSRLTGYVPNPEGSKSGVTIATGVDLSAETNASLAGLPFALRHALAPYLGLSGAEAVQALDAQPLTISAADAAVLNAYIRQSEVEILTDRYDGESATLFDELPDQAQTIIASVAFQYGDLRTRCPRFWLRATRLDWAGCVVELRTFGDAYPTRRSKEADYLTAIVP